MGLGKAYNARHSILGCDSNSLKLLGILIMYLSSAKHPSVAPFYHLGSYAPLRLHCFPSPLEGGTPETNHNAAIAHNGMQSVWYQCLNSSVISSHESDIYLINLCYSILCLTQTIAIRTVYLGMVCLLPHSNTTTY